MRQYQFFGATFDPTRKYRFMLWRIWDSSKPRVGFIMLNPSTTEEDPKTDDATIRRCTGFADSWGYGGFEVGNLYAYRSSDPDKLFEVGDPIGNPQNDQYLFKMHGRNDMTVIAWGTHPAAKAREQKVKYLLVKTGTPLWAIGVKKKDGRPLHPLYLPSSARPYIAVSGDSKNEIEA